MNYRILAISLFLLCFLKPINASALTVEEFSKICDSVPGECSEYPFLQAYVGGALDLLAVLDEETDHLQKIYCKHPKELFNVSEIIRYMQAHRQEYASRNAMILLVRYIEENGGCNTNE